MFIPIHLLPRFDPDERDRCKMRWIGGIDRHEIGQRVLELIKQEAGEDFLQRPFEQGELPILENYHDLKGVMIAGEDTTASTPPPRRTLRKTPCPAPRCWSGNLRVSRTRRHWGARWRSSALWPSSTASWVDGGWTWASIPKMANWRLPDERPRDTWSAARCGRRLPGRRGAFRDRTGLDARRAVSSTLRDGSRNTPALRGNRRCQSDCLIG